VNEIIFSAWGISEAACRNSCNQLERGETFIENCVRNVVRILGSDFFMEMFLSFIGACISINIRNATQKLQLFI
jgi:uncharacterized membrane protein